MRRPLPSKLFHHGIARKHFFEDVVTETCEYLKEAFPEELGKLSWAIEDVPQVSEQEPIRRFSSDKKQMLITLYRIPIQRIGKMRISDPRLQIEQAVISAAAALIDADPWDLIHPN
ncbi:MAG: metallopeptidase family protein [Actinobacteria bacterium]|nr:metallopeptidase family protein [Actinomycetota bacterium]